MFACVPLGQFKCLGDSPVEARLADREKVDGGEDRGQQAEDLQLMSRAGFESEGRHAVLRRAASSAVTRGALCGAPDACFVQALDKMRHAVQLEAVEDLLAAFVAGYDSRFAQDIQVLRGGRPAEPDGVDEVADAALAVHQGPHECEPTGIAEGFEDLVRRCAKRLAGHGTKYFAK